MNGTEILAEFRATRAEARFSELVRRYTNLVYSIAKRRVADMTLAQEVTQIVFIRLAKSPPKLDSEAKLLGWLHRTTVHVSIDLWRSETRRRAREQEVAAMQTESPEDAAWNKMTPVLDDALDKISEEDRQVILLRFFDQRTMASLGQTLGVSEDAAKMRVSRAVGRLRARLGDVGMPLTAALLGSLLLERSVQAAPDALATALATIKITAPVGSAGAVLASLFQSPGRRLLSGLAAALLVGGAVTLLLHEAKHNADPDMRIATATATNRAKLVNISRKSAAGTDQPAAIAQPEETNRFTGTVIDKFTRNPVEGATVHVRREKYSATGNKVLQETEHLTDAEGHFQFTLTPEQSANSSLYLNFEVTHSNYAPRAWDGYALGMIRKNESLGEHPFYDHLDVTPAENISGTLVQPDGSAAVGVKVLAYSKANQNDLSEYGSFADTVTDASGAFRLNVVRGGEAVLWLLPQDFAPSTHLLHQQRGDLGRFLLEGGVRLTGVVLDSSGAPVSNVWVNVEISRGPAKKDIHMPVMDAVGRSALSDEKGEFVTGPLPPSEYNVLITDHPRDSSYHGGLADYQARHPVPDVFLHQKVSLESVKPTQWVEIRAVPHVLITIQQLDSKGMPHKTHSIHASGRLAGQSWWDEGLPDKDGKILLKAPQGATNARFDIGLNEHQSARYRWSDDSPWRNEKSAAAQVLDHDINQMSVTYYTAPILLVRAVDRDGNAVADFKCQAAYVDGRKPYEEPPHWVSGASGDVNFDKQEDGRWRSEQLLPDENITLTVEAAGFKTWTRSLSLPEGATQDVEAQLQK